MKSCKSPFHLVGFMRFMHFMLNFLLWQTKVGELWVIFRIVVLVRMKNTNIL